MMGLLNFLHKPKTIDISNLDFELFKNYGWELTENANKNLKKFPIEAFRDGDFCVNPCLFEKSIKIPGFRDCSFGMWVEARTNKIYWQVVGDWIIYEITHFPTESDLIKMDEAIKTETDSWIKSKLERESLDELRNKKISELTPNELQKLGIKF